MSILNLKVGLFHLKVGALVCGAFLLSQAGIGQQQHSLFDSQPFTPDPIDWKVGPTNVIVGGTVTVNIPEGYRFFDQTGASKVLERMDLPVSKNLVGLLAPTPPKWFMVLEFADIGYVKDDDKDRLDAAAMLESARGWIARQNRADSSGSVTNAVRDWVLKPVYHQAEHKMEWAIRVDNQKSAVVNYTARFFGRRGVLDAIAVQPYKANLDLTPLQKAAGEISFLEGERYADYRPGDKLAGFSLAELAANENSWDLASISTGGSKGLIIGIVVALLVLTGMGWGVIAWRMVRLREARRAETTEGVSGPRNGEPQATSASQVSSVLGEAGVAPTPKTVSAQQSAAMRKPIANWKPSRSKHGGRKRRFNFDAYYTEMIMSLTSGSSGEPQPLVSLVNGKSGEVNGVASNPHMDTGALPMTAQALLTEASRLIDGQQKLIAGQRRFIDEQSRLIEEKHKLIDAETRILEKQAELFDERLF